MRSANQPIGKILEHTQGLGTVTKDMVIQRARELAIINGRPPNHYSNEDFLQAKRELTGRIANEAEMSEEEPIAGLTTWDEEPGTSGHAVKRAELIDEQTVSEQLVEEGISEAEHEQMVEGARSPHNQE